MSYEGIEIFNGVSLTAVELFDKYASLVKSRATKFSSVECELEDIIQEGNIGLIYAARKFDGSLSSFPTFARRCVDAAIIDYLRKNSKLSQIPQENLVEIDSFQIADSSSDPEAALFSKEEYLGIISKAKSLLSAKEFSVFSDMVLGFSRDEIATRNGMDAKSVNNAVQRIRSKFK